jgi:uncharacterized repeat protein (TIGR01451 family)
VYVVVLDGLKPAEVGPLTPTLSGLHDQGTWYEQARAVFPAETLPNHVAVMTGVRPERNGIVGNEYWHPNEPAEPSFYMDDPSLLDADTLTTRLENACGAAISTATVQSKTYLHGVFRGEEPRPGDANPQREADFHWAPPFYVPISDHAPDVLTMDGFRTWVREQPASLPRFAFVNLGDIDRAGHADEIGGTTSGAVTPARQAAIEDTDTQLGLLVDDLRESGTWDETVLILASDHSMDWGPYEQQVEVEAPLTTAGYRLDSAGSPPATPGGSGDFNVVGGGGTGAVYAEDEADVPEMARVLDALPGVAFVATRDPVPGLGNPTLGEVGMDHPRNGDIVVFVEPHWRIGDGNPLPGNHGHPATQQSLLLVTGGHPLLGDSPARIAGEPVFDPARKLFSPPAGGPGNLSIAPTVAGLLGLGEPAGGYDGQPLSAAFEDYAFLPHRPCEAAGPPPDLAVAITDQPDPVRRNSVLTYTVVVDNRGAATASEVTLRDQLPDTVRLRSVRSTQGSCAASGRSVECGLGALPADARATVTIEVRADRAGTITNRATATAGEPEVERANNEAAEATTVLPTGG